MYCKYCGKELEDSAAFCPHCGKAVNAAPNNADLFYDAPQPTPTPAPYPAQKKTNTLAIVGFVLSFFVSLAGLICSIIARKQCQETGEDGAGFALAGIIISAVSMGLAIMFGIIWGSVFGAALITYTSASPLIVL